MSLAELKDKAARLQPAEQRELIAFLVRRQTEQEDQATINASAEEFKMLDAEEG